MHERIRSCVSIEARVESFLENFVKLGLQCVNMRDAGRARCHPFALLFSEFEKVEVETAVRYFLRARESFFGCGEERKTGRQGERFLRAGEHDVDAKRVHVDLNAGEG